MEIESRDHLKALIDWYLGSSLVAFNSSYDILMATLVLVHKGDTQVKMDMTVFLETKSLRS